MYKKIQKYFQKNTTETSFFPHIKDVKDLQGKRVMVRVDFNVPLGDDEHVTNEEAWRIDAALPTIQFLIEQKARIILISHIGRDLETSLRPVAEYLNLNCGVRVGFIPELTGTLATHAVENLAQGNVILLENLRSDERETKNDSSLTRELAGMADIYVNDAFSASHRDHVSIVGLPSVLPAYFGFQCIEEIKHLTRALNPEHPTLFIMGGAKFDTKLPLLETMLPKAETVFIGGALAHTFFKYKGYEIGTSLFSDDQAVKGFLETPNILLPREVLVENKNGSENKSVDNLDAGDKIVDLGMAAVSDLSRAIHNAKTIIWNGPLGWYEGGYDHGTKQVLDLIAKSSATSIIGGGDTVFVIRTHAMQNDFSFVSTAGGAMLDFLTHGTLPGIDAIMRKK